jgi:hypothetical protein
VDDERFDVVDAETDLNVQITVSPVPEGRTADEMD